MNGLERRWRWSWAEDVLLWNVVRVLGWLDSIGLVASRVVGGRGSADEVGFGKTGQVIGFLQVLWHLKIMQDSNPEWPDTSGLDVAMKWPPFLG